MGKAFKKILKIVAIAVAVILVVVVAVVAVCVSFGLALGPIAAGMTFGTALIGALEFVATSATLWIGLAGLAFSTFQQVKAAEDAEADQKKANEELMRELDAGTDRARQEVESHFDYVRNQQLDEWNGLSLGYDKYDVAKEKEDVKRGILTAVLCSAGVIAALLLLGDDDNSAAAQA